MGEEVEVGVGEAEAGCATTTTLTPSATTVESVRNARVSTGPVVWKVAVGRLLPDPKKRAGLVLAAGGGPISSS